MEHIEEMSAFFAARADGYDEHMHTNIEGIEEAYARMAALLPEGAETLLDLGCGTGLELEAIFDRFPKLHVTGIDLTQAMLDRLAGKYPGRNLTLICGSYFDVPFAAGQYDAAVSFQTLHHFTHAEKRGLYRCILAALRLGGVYIEADYTVATQAEEDALFAQRDCLLAETDGGLWHIDVPCTVENQLRLLGEAGFARVRLEGRYGNTAVMTARKEEI